MLKDLFPVACSHFVEMAKSEGQNVPKVLCWLQLHPSGPFQNACCLEPVRRRIPANSGATAGFFLRQTVFLEKFEPN